MALQSSDATGVLAPIAIFTDSSLIADGIVGLLPRAWREQAVIVERPAALAARTPRTAVIVDAEAPGAEAVLQAAIGDPEPTIVLIGSGEPPLDPETLEQADAIIRRDEAEPLTIRVALAAGRVGMRLVPRAFTPPAPATGDQTEDDLPEQARTALALLAAGMRDAEIAAALNLSESAVRKLVQRTVRRLGARTRCQAVAIAARTGELAQSQSAPADPHTWKPS